MSVTNYLTADGSILYENRAGTEHDYMADQLGSTMALLDRTQSQTDTFSYWPYGEVNARTGTTATAFVFVGTLGYAQDSASRIYVRHRHLRTDDASWLSLDPLWPLQDPYRYGGGAPTLNSDPSGLYVIWNLSCGGIGAVKVAPSPGDQSGVVGGRDSTSGQNAFSNLWPGATGKDCVAMNGSFAQWPKPMGPLTDCHGRSYPWEPGEPSPVTIVTDHGSLTGSGRAASRLQSPYRPPMHGGRPGGYVGRTGACVGPGGQLTGVVLSPHAFPGQADTCFQNACAGSGRLVWLDGSGATQIWERLGGGGVNNLMAGSAGTGPDYRANNNWIVICGKSQ